MTKESMNLKEQGGEWNIGGLGGRKGKKEMFQLYYNFKNIKKKPKGTLPKIFY